MRNEFNRSSLWQQSDSVQCEGRKKAIEVSDSDELLSVLQTLKTAVESGELDQQVFFLLLQVESLVLHLFSLLLVYESPSAVSYCCLLNYKSKFQFDL